MAEHRQTDLIQPTPDEAKNGWDAASLSAYHAERERAVTEKLGLCAAQHQPWGTKSVGQRNRPSRTVSGYSPHRW